MTQALAQFLLKQESWIENGSEGNKFLTNFKNLLNNVGKPLNFKISSVYLSENNPNYNKCD